MEDNLLHLHVNPHNLLKKASRDSPLSNLTGIDSEFQGNRKMVKTLKMNRLFNHFSIPDSESIYFPSLRNEEIMQTMYLAEMDCLNER